jgi:hypothetical protein
MKKIWKNWLSSFNDKKSGFSARKLTAFVTVLCIIYIHLRFIDTTNSVEALLYDMSFVLLLLGIVTADQLYRLKHGDESKDEGGDTDETETSETPDNGEEAPKE